MGKIIILYLAFLSLVEARRLPHFHPVGSSFDPGAPRLTPLQKPIPKSEYTTPVPLRVVAIGDSITQGSCSSDETTKSWPSQLYDMLGHNNATYEVFNYGVSGTTMMKTGDNPYWNREAYQLALTSEADVIFMMLGTNDAKTYQWNQTQYINDYLEMASNFLAMDSSPELFIMVPPPLYLDGVYSMNQTVINTVLPIVIPDDIVTPLLEQYGEDRIQPFVSIFDAMGSIDLTQYQAFCDLQNCDQCHPNDAGYGLLAMTTFKALMGGPPLPTASISSL